MVRSGINIYKKRSFLLDGGYYYHYYYYEYLQLSRMSNWHLITEGHIMPFSTGSKEMKNVFPKERQIFRLRTGNGSNRQRIKIYSKCTKEMKDIFPKERQIFRLRTGNSSNRQCIKIYSLYHQHRNFFAFAHCIPDTPPVYALWTKERDNLHKMVGECY